MNRRRRSEVEEGIPRDAEQRSARLFPREARLRRNERWLFDTNDIETVIQSASRGSLSCKAKAQELIHRPGEYGLYSLRSLLDMVR